MLTAVRPTGERIKGLVEWLFKCDCGNEITAAGALVRFGSPKSCGCSTEALKAAKVTKHGGAKRAGHAPEYAVWAGMIQRCTNPADLNYHNYGGRGITVCDRWRESFEAFKSDMGPRPSQRHTIDRIDVNGNYEPSNCRWATATEQARNTRSNRRITVGDVTLCVAEWAERSGIPIETVHARLYRGRACRLRPCSAR
jgi:hypothetical protein